MTQDTDDGEVYSHFEMERIIGIDITFLACPFSFRGEERGKKGYWGVAREECVKLAGVMIRVDHHGKKGIKITSVNPEEGEGQGGSSVWEQRQGKGVELPILSLVSGRRK